MPSRYVFDRTVLNAIAGGRSVIDLPKLNLYSLDEANAFVKAYGFNVQDSKEQEKLWYFHRRALVFLQEKLGCNTEEIPPVLIDRKNLEDLRKLLLWASSTQENERELQRWSCALLRVMHVFVHSERDLFSSFSEEVQKQILTPFQNSVVHDGVEGKIFLKSADPKSELEAIPLEGFEVKPFKTSSSTVIKLLAKPDALAMNVFDKLGVRFITKNVFDVFRVIRFLAQENLTSFPHIIPDQSTNTIYPINVFLNACSELTAENRILNDNEIDFYFADYLKKHPDVKFLKKENSFSGTDYQFIKFISRKLIQIRNDEKSDSKSDNFSFFYPYEVQIMDKSAYRKIQSGPSEHQAYKERQKQAAKERLFASKDL
jgi:uncharacterized protein (TIGR04552 family)